MMAKIYSVSLLLINATRLVLLPIGISLMVTPTIANAQTRTRARQSSSVTGIKRTIKKLTPLATRLGEPKPGEWLAAHKETGQSFSEYLRIRPNILTERRNKLYVQPIGDFADKQKELVTLSAEFLSLYFNCEVVTLAAMDESEIPASAKRVHPSWGGKQLLTTHILDNILAQELPEDAFAAIAFTTTDLWPGDGWNFVFGQAALRHRVGVWSLQRYGDPTKDDAAFRKVLGRTIKVATHETGHMFSIKHCIKYSCNMQGSNSLPESDTQPLALCPECHAKVLYATGAEPVDRYEKLIAFCRKHGMKKEADRFGKAKARLE